MANPLNTVKQLHEQGYRLVAPPVAIVTLDPSGAGEDFNALTWIDREEWQRGEVTDKLFSVQRLYRLQVAQRLPQSAEFGDLVAQMLRINLFLKKRRNKKLLHSIITVVETNGVGWGIFNQVKKKIGDGVIGIITVTGTNSRAFSGGRMSMPRLPGLDHLRVLLETHLLKMHPKTPGAKEIESEFRSFVWKRAGRPEALDGQKDDLLMSLAIGCWVGEKVVPATVRQQLPPRSRRRA